ncbi:MAG: hypothetical protein HY868_02885 [Chloroflexi bacterium]|nr:hypothetical protein [Chloroflexota bacterium]
MLKPISRFIAFGALALTLFAATACSAIPSLPLQPAAPAIASPGPTAAPVATPEAQAQAQPKNRDAQNLNGVEAIVKRLGMTAGVVRGSNDAGLALRTLNGNEKIRVDTSTIIVVRGKTNAKVTDIQTGDRVLVNTRSKKDLADFVLVLPATYSPDNLEFGAVQSSISGSVTVRTRKDSQTVAANATTVVVKTDQDTPALGSMADVKQGNVVIVLGENAGATYNAQTIVILKDNLRGLLTPNQKPDPALPRQKPNAPVPTPKSGG